MNIIVEHPMQPAQTLLLLPDLSKSGTRKSDMQAIKAAEFELALGAQDIRANGFESCIAKAAEVCGLEPLFNLPLIPELQTKQRVAAVASIESGNTALVFVALDETGEHVEIDPDMSSSPHFKNFAESYLDLMIC